MACFRGLAALLFACVLVSCGGGGGGGGSSSGSSSGGGGSGRGQFSLSGSAASFTAFQGLPSPAAQSFTMTITGSGVAAVGAAYASGQTPAPWLLIDMNGSGNSYTLTVQPIAGMSGVDPGTHTAAFTVGTADSSGNILRTQVVNVTYVLNAALQVTNISSDIERVHVFGSASRVEEVPLVVAANNRQWTITSNAAWLRVPAGTQNGNATVNATIDLTGVAPGNHVGAVTLTNAAHPADSVTRIVRVHIEPARFDVADDDFLFGGDEGRDTLATQQLDFSLATGDGVHPFTITAVTDSGGQWLTLDRTTGTVGAAGASVTLGIDRGQLPGGTYTAEVTVSTDVYGVRFAETIPVTLNMEAHRIVVSAAGVALSRVAGRDVLTRSLEVFSNLGRAGTQWNAVSDSPWLTVTASGTVGQDLVLTATPGALAADTTHIANVTITSPTAGVENTQSVRVGLYLSATAPVDAAVNQNTRSVAASPVEPWFAVATLTDVELRHVYTNALVRTLTAAVDEPGQMTFGADGRSLFVHDVPNDRVTEFEVATGAVVRHFDAPSRDASQPPARAIAVARPDGFAMLVTPNIHFYDLATGNLMNIGSWSNFLDQGLNVSPDQSLLVRQEGGAILIRRSALEGGVLRFVPHFFDFPMVSYSREACMNAAGDTIYTGAQDVGPAVVAGATLEPRAVVHRLPAIWFVRAIECTWNGLLIAGFQASSDPFDLYIFDEASGTLLDERNSDLSDGVFIPNRQVLERGIAVSGDGTRMLTAWLTGTSNFPVGFATQTLPEPP